MVVDRVHQRRARRARSPPRRSPQAPAPKVGHRDHRQVLGCAGRCLEGTAAVGGAAWWRGTTMPSAPHGLGGARDGAPRCGPGSRRAPRAARADSVWSRRSCNVSAARAWKYPAARPGGARCGRCRCKALARHLLHQDVPRLRVLEDLGRAGLGTEPPPRSLSCGPDGPPAALWSRGVAPVRGCCTASAGRRGEVRFQRWPWACPPPRCHGRRGGSGGGTARSRAPHERRHAHRAIVAPPHRALPGDRARRARARTNRVRRRADAAACAGSLR